VSEITEGYAILKYAVTAVQYVTIIRYNKIQ